MRTGVAYMGHHNPKHLISDFREMRALQLDEAFVCLQENDFVHFTGKLKFTPQIAREHGVRPIALSGSRSTSLAVGAPANFCWNTLNVSKC